MLFSHAKLNELTDIMTNIGNNLSGSSDYILKMDTDEFLMVSHEETNELKPSLVKKYLSNFRNNTSHPLSYNKEDPNMCVRFVQDSQPSKDLCDKNSKPRADMFPLSLPHFNPRFKAVFDSRFIHEYGINLGGHALNHAENCVDKGSFSIIHSQYRCLEENMENDRNVLEGENYFDHTDSSDVIIDKLTNMLQCDWGNDPNYPDCNWCEKANYTPSSFHKAVQYLNYLNCPERANDYFYNITNPSDIQSVNEDFQKTMRSSLEHFRISAQLVD